MKWSLRHAVRTIAVLAAIGTLVLSFAPSLAAAVASGLVDPGFESGALTSWDVAPGGVEPAVIVGEEGPHDFPVYASRGTTVTPRAGTHMLRLGAPRPRGTQPRGSTTVSQRFTSTTSTLKIAVRVLSWEFRGEDAVVIDLVNDAGTRVGTPRAEGGASSFRVTMTDAKVVSYGAMPVSVAPKSLLKNALMDTGWLVLEITDVPTGSPVTLTYSVATPKDSSHPTWAYFDNVNTPPSVSGSSYGTDEYTLLPVSAPGVLRGATDPEGDPLTAVLDSSPLHGGLTLNADGSFSYMPDRGFVGSDSFAFRASDGQSFSDTASATIVVSSFNDGPRPGVADVTTPEDTPAHVTLPSSDPLGPLTYYTRTDPSHGTLTGTWPNVEYGPQPDYNGFDSFTVFWTDGLLRSGVRTVWVTVTPVNDPPVAQELDSFTNEGTPVTLTLLASDKENDSITFQIAKQPLHGQLSAIAGDKIVYTPAEGYFGPDSFRVWAWELWGGVGAAALAVVSVDPLVAMFECLPVDPREGEIVGTWGDLSHVVQPGLSIVSWNWAVSGPDGFVDNYEGENSMFMPPQQGSYEVTLTVTDTRGATATTHTVVTVANDPPRVKALNLEALPGGTATAFGRFLDAGWTDAHTASVDFGGSRTAAIVEDNVPVLSSGVATVQIPAGTGGAGSLTVADDSGSVTTPFTVTIVQPGTDRSAADDTITDRDKATFPKARGNGSYLSYIKTAGDVDLYEVVMPDGSALPYGTEVLVNLKELPTDLDVAVLSELPSGLNQSLQNMQSVPLDQGSVGASWGRSTWGRSTWGRSTWGRSTWGRSTWGRSTWGRSTWGRSTWGRSTWGRSTWGRSTPGRYDALDIYTWPLSDMSYTGLENANVSGGDITLSDLGLSIPTGADISIAGFSANRGLQDEAVLVRTESFGNRMYVAVFGANKAFDAGKPYTLQVETSKPEDLEALWGTSVPQEPLVPLSQATHATLPLETAPQSQPLTLFVTQAERFKARYGIAAWDSMLGSLTSVAARPDVAGKILSVPSTYYDAWDKDPYSVDRANAVTDEIRAIVQTVLASNPTIKYVVFVGDDRIVPFHRTHDDTLIGNEYYYGAEAFVQPTSPLFSSMAGKYFLSDDFYADAAPIPWQGRALYVPDVVTSRLVESPDEIKHSIDTFMEKNGQLTPSTGFVSGYDFFDDGSTAIADTMNSGLLQVDRLISGTWTAADLRQRLFSSAAGPDLAAVNAHFTQFAGVSAAGFAGSDWNDSFKSVEMSVPLAPGTSIEGGVIYTLGCHAGMSVPDTDAVSADPSYGVDTALDFPQAMARQGAVYVGNTGFGLGDTQGIALSELLSQMYTEDLLQNGGTTVGEALRSSKQRYLLSAASLTAYDEKASGEFTLYGLPQYKVNTQAGPLAKTGASASSIQAAAMARRLSTAISSSPAGDFKLTVDNGTPTLHPRMSIVTSAGTYYTADGNTQESDSRPIQPKVVQSLDSSSAGPVHGVLLQGGKFTETQPFNPVIAKTVTGWDRDSSEAQVSSDGYWPSSPVTLKSLVTASAEPSQALVVVPGQFKATSATGSTVSGIERLWDEMDLGLTRSTSDHWAPPEIGAIRMYAPSFSDITVSVEASDAVSGIAAIVVTHTNAVFGDTTFMSSTRADFGPTAPRSGVYQVGVPLQMWQDPADVQVLIQVVDNAGNVAVSTGKGASMHPVHVDVAGPPTGIINTPVTFTGAVASYGTLVQPVMYSLDFGDGLSSSGPLFPGDVTIDASGTASFSFPHSYDVAGTYTVRLNVSDAVGGFGSRETSITIASVDTVAPYVQIVSPTSMSTVGNAIDVTVNAGEIPTAPVTQSGMAYVDFAVDGVTVATDNDPPYIQTLDLSGKANGVHEVWATAFDVAGNSSRAVIQVNKNVPLAWTAMSHGSYHTLALRSDGSVWAWGFNFNSQLGSFAGTSSALPVRVGTENDWVKVFAGGSSSFAIKRDGSLWGWGYGGFGALGIGDKADKAIPTRIGLDNNWTSVSANGHHSLALKNDGSLWEWGLVYVSEVPAQFATPTQVGGPEWRTASAGYYHSLAIKNDGTLWSWGVNNNGQLGTSVGTTGTPVQVGTATDWASVSGGGYHSLGTKNDGSLWGWGSNYYGELGDGTMTSKWAPARIGTENLWRSVSAGTQYSLGIKADGSVWAWGDNFYGQLGDGTALTRTTPVPVVAVPPGFTVAQAGNGWNSVAFHPGAGIWTWGCGDYGQLGNGQPSGNRPLPTPVPLIP